MRIEKLELQDFRGIEKLSMPIGRQLTVIVGVNGAGKTSVLDAIAIALSHYVARLARTSSSARKLSDDDVKNGSKGAKIRLFVNEKDDKYRWTIYKQEQSEKVLRPLPTDYRGVQDLVKKVARRHDGSDNYLVGETLAVFYNQKRAVLDIPQRRRGRISHAALDAFAESLDIGRIDFRKFTYWFQERETDELRKQRDVGRKYVDPQLNAVRKAIFTATGLKNPYYRIESPRGLVFKKRRATIHVNQLSTGEKIYMALAGDLARRLAIMNPDARNPLAGKAIVLIDEIELHLHPQWQRLIISWLTATFPNSQFIVTTHSPQVLSEVPADSVRVLAYNRGEVSLSYINASRGRDSNFLLASVFGTDERPTDVKDIISKIDQALAQNQFEEARLQIQRLKGGTEGGDPQVDIAETRLMRRVGNAKK